MQADLQSFGMRGNSDAPVVSVHIMRYNQLVDAQHGMRFLSRHNFDQLDKYQADLITSLHCILKCCRNIPLFKDLGTKQDACKIQQ